MSTASPDTGCRRFLLAALVAGSLVVAACGADSDQPIGAQPEASASVVPIVPEASGSSSAPVGVIRDPFVRNGEGVALPKPELTPGAVFKGVGAVEICDLYYTQGVRQPRFNAKVDAFARYGVNIHDRDLFELDHLVPISLGGSNEPTNLWPEPYDPAAGAQAKNLLERQLRGLVCSDELSLADAQHAVATDWWLAYGTYMGRPIKPGSAGLEPPVPFEPEPGEVVNGGPCEVEGAVGLTVPKGIRLTCTASGLGELRWQKRS
jgi:hypothetical protein